MLCLDFRDRNRVIGISKIDEPQHTILPDYDFEFLICIYLL